MNLLKSVIQYLLSTLRHKWYVFYAGVFIVGNVPLWRLLVHDWTKFMPVEFVNYAKYYKMGRTDKEAFLKAWLHHQKNNKHHPEYWTSVGIFEWSNCSILMPETYVREMVADLLGASKEYTGSWDMSEWLKNNFKRWDYCDWGTCERLRDILNEIGYYSIVGYWNTGLCWDPMLVNKPKGV